MFLWVKANNRVIHRTGIAKEAEHGSNPCWDENIEWHLFCLLSRSLLSSLVKSKDEISFEVWADSDSLPACKLYDYLHSMCPADGIVGSEEFRLRLILTHLYTRKENLSLSILAM